MDSFKILQRYLRLFITVVSKRVNHSCGVFPVFVDDLRVLLQWVPLKLKLQP